MTKGKRRSPRRWIKKRFGRRRDKRMPFSVGIGLGVSILAPPWPGAGSVKEKVEHGDFDQALQSFVASWTGLRIGGIGGQRNTEMNIIGLINPFDTQCAPALKATLWSGIVFKIMKAVIHKDPLAKVPVINKFIKMS